jgi:hypothetical protein
MKIQQPLLLTSDIRNFGEVVKISGLFMENQVLSRQFFTEEVLHFINFSLYL